MVNYKQFSLIIILLFFFSPQVFGQESDRIIHYKVRSEVTINGTSNVKNFTCTAIKDYYQNPNKVIVTRNPGIFTYQNAIVHINVDNFDCHMNKMTKVMKQTLQAEKYPTVIVEIKKIKLPDQRMTRLENGDNIVADADVTIAGKTKSYKIAFENVIIEKNKLVTFNGKLDLDMTAHDIVPPTVMGFIKVSQHISIDFILNFKVL